MNTHRGAKRKKKEIKIRKCKINIFEKENKNLQQMNRRCQAVLYYQYNNCCKKIKILKYQSPYKYIFELLDNKYRENQLKKDIKSNFKMLMLQNMIRV